SWSWITEDDGTPPDQFNIYYGTEPGVEVGGTPDVVVAYTDDTRYTYTFTLYDATQYWFVVTSQLEYVESEKVTEIGPVLADATAPPEPEPTVSTVQ
ncbi:unnamed protein product, partial [marine sediment metagenome]